MRNSQLSIFATILFSLFLTISCSDKNLDAQLGTTILDTMSSEDLHTGTRTAVLLEDEAEVEEEAVTFTVIYNGDLNEMANNDDSAFKALLDDYELKMEKPFEIDEENKGIILVPTSPIAAPIELGKEISLIDGILMVEVDNVRKDKNVN